MIDAAQLVPVAAGIWGIIVFASGALAGKWVSGMAERKRANTEGFIAEQAASAANRAAADRAEIETRTILNAQVQDQLTRMAAKIELLEAQVAELRENERRYLDEIHVLRNGRDIAGQVRQSAQAVVSADRMDKIDAAFEPMKTVKPTPAKRVVKAGGAANADRPKRKVARAT